MSRAGAVGVAVFLVLAAMAARGGAENDPTGLPQCSVLGPGFCVDAAYFLADGAHTVQVYFSVCNQGLQFVKVPGGYQAGADLSAVLLDGEGDQVAGDTYRLKLFCRDYEATTSVDSCTSQRMAFDGAAGDFKLVLGLYDRDSRARGVVEARLKIPRLLDLPSLSDLVFLDRAADCDRDDPRGFAPNISRIYRDERDSVQFYYEVYHGAGRDTLGVFHEITQSDGGKVHQRSLVSVGPGTAGGCFAAPVESLPNGMYGLRIGIRSAAGEVVASRYKEFEIRRDRFHLTRDLDQAVAVLTYIARSSEIDAFVKAGEDDRKRLWEEFWLERDPTPGTPRNEYQEEYLRRFRYANANFGVPLTEGWRTDRGRIYILFGEPDEIDSYPFEEDRRPTEVWHYYSQARRFVFVDETGFGDYVLVGGGG
ncbi:MAG: GWxTD domain-containing protein [bacterium]